MYPNSTPDLQNPPLAPQPFASLAGGARELRDQAAPLLDRAAERAAALAQRGIDAVRDRTHQIGERSHRMADDTRAYVRDEPFKSMLVAAVAGAALVALLSWLGDSRRRG